MAAALDQTHRTGRRSRPRRPRTKGGIVTMDPDVFDQEALKRELAEIITDPLSRPVLLTRWQCYCLVGAVQLAIRHPEFKDTTMAEMACVAARRLQAQFGGVLGDLVELGWTMAADGEPGP